MPKMNVVVDGQTYEVEVSPLHGTDQEFTVRVDGVDVPVSVPPLTEAEMEWIIVGGHPYELAVDHELRWLKSWHGLHSVAVHDQGAGAIKPASGDGRVKAPVPGLLTRVLVNEGDRVEAGQPVVILEAMKMENEIRAPRSGQIARLASPGQSVMLGQVLVEIE